jgi:hypothetical protein
VRVRRGPGAYSGFVTCARSGQSSCRARRAAWRACCLVSDELERTLRDCAHQAYSVVTVLATRSVDPIAYGSTLGVAMLIVLGVQNDAIRPSALPRCIE